MEVLMGNDATHPFKVGIGGGRGLGQDSCRVEDVEPFVLHRTHVEVVDCDNVIHVEVILTTIRLLVPRHRLLEAGQCPVELVDVLMLRPQRQPHLPSRGSGESTLDAAQITGHEGEEVRGLAERVDKRSPMTTSTCVPLADFVAIREQQWVLARISLDAYLIRGHDVRTVLEVCDPPEAFSFTLRHKHAGGLVQAAELRVLVRRNRYDSGQLEGLIPLRRMEDGETVCGKLIVSALGERHAVQLDGAQLQVLAIKIEARLLAGGNDG
mmetsp:Transcript_2793/g.5893  ORF Transcript_2793/g.5893 Transcript_2793/m.5893 type:complete len:267 (+) Transcript_2793:2084-2884(+)